MKIYLSPSDQDKNKYAYGNTNEMVQCQRIADACEAALKRCGFEVKNNQKDGMEKRVSESNSWKADMHIPIHTNAFNGKVTGTRVFYYAQNGYGNVAAKAVYDVLKNVTAGTSDNIQAAPNLYELKHTDATAVYVEADFHDVPTMAKWIIEHVTEIGEGIAKGVCNYYKVKYIAPTNTPNTPTNKTLYRVQVGAFEKKSNAEALLAKLKKDGYSGFVTTDSK